MRVLLERRNLGGGARQLRDEVPAWDGASSRQRRRSDCIARQRPSAMPFERYEPYQKQFAIDLPDRQWPSKVVEAAKK